MEGGALKERLHSRISKDRGRMNVELLTRLRRECVGAPSAHVAEVSAKAKLGATHNRLPMAGADKKKVQSGVHIRTHVRNAALNGRV